MFGYQRYQLANSVEEKIQRLRALAADFEERSYGKIDGAEFAENFITNFRLLECFNRAANKFRLMCELYAVEAAEPAIRATSGNDTCHPGEANHLMKNACEKLLNFNYMQHIELICIHNAFQCSDSIEFDTTDHDLAVVFTYVFTMIGFKATINGNHVVAVNGNGFDNADLQEILHVEYLDFDELLGISSQKPYI